MLTDDIIEEIFQLISLKQEGGYWDFKREWHTNHTDLLHDIICFANNLENRDCYIVIGVDDNLDYEIVDVSNDPNRKNTQKIVDFLKDKKFAGGIRPVALVESISIGMKTIDVLVIKNRFDTPYYLTESYQGVFKSNIYTRVMDTNTPTNASADINHVEYLWKKRFRLLEQPLERVRYYLRNPEDWVNSPIDYEDSKFYKYAPEFQIKTESDDLDGYEFYLFTQYDPRPHWYNTTLYYHQTALETFQEIGMDGCRWQAIAPQRSSIRDRNDYSTTEMPHYGYYIEGSLRCSLHLFINADSQDMYEYKKYMALMLIFYSEEERIEFEEYVLLHKADYDKLFAEQDEPYMEQLDGYNMAAFKHDYKSSLVLQSMLSQFRISKCRT